MFTLHITLLVHTLGKPADVFRNDRMRAIDFRVNKDLTDVALGRSYAVQCSVFIATNIQDRQPRRVLYFVYRINILLASYGNKFCYPLLFLMFFSTYFFLSFFLYSLLEPLLSPHLRCSGLLRPITLSDTRTHTHTHTLGTTPLDEGSAHRRDLYLTTQNIQKRETNNPTRTTDSHLRRIISTSCCIHTVVPPDDGPRYDRNM